MNESKKQYPVDEAVPRLMEALDVAHCAVLSAPPGAGKTTRVPLALLAAPWLHGRKILMLEPRRLAARRAAGYMAQQLSERTGQTVGYRIRGDAAVSSQTRVEVVTEGILTRMIHADPELPDVGLVIFDEFHERSIHADLGLAFTLDVQNHLRNDLRILVMSATLDGVAVANLLRNAPVIESAGTLFPVDTRYSRFASDKPIDVRVAETISRVLQTEEGDMLVFLPGMREIRRVEEKLLPVSMSDVKVHLLHGDLPPGVQEAALAPARPGTRKVILSTSIAETSLTIDGVRIVVDSGLARSARFDPRRGMSGLVTVPVSRAVADQRRGRAGRQGPGVCYRLWTEEAHHQLQDYPVPEIKVSDLAHVALDLAQWGSPTGDGLSFLDPPPAPHLGQAQSVLKSLGALTDDGRLTQHGRLIAELPIHPRLAHMIVEGKKIGAGALACELAALLEERDSLPGGNKNDVDVASRLDALRTGSGLQRGMADRITAQKRRLMETMSVDRDTAAEDRTGILLAMAYPERIARKRPDRAGVYQLSGGSLAKLPAGSLLAREEFLSIADADIGSGDAKIYLAAPVRASELENSFSAEITEDEEIAWSEEEQKVKARRIRKLGSVILSDSQLEPSGEAVTRALIEGIRRTGLRCLPWDKASDQFRLRAEWARKTIRQLADWPECSDDKLLESLESWLAPCIQGMWKLEHLQRLNCTDLLRSLFTHQQLRELERLAPSHVQVPSGSRIALDYSPTDHPSLSVKLQELFGLTETPRIAGGTIPVTIHLLSPAARPLAVTQDLHSFWQNTYPEIRKQLRARYPRHPWPEDPLSAAPTRRTLKRR